MGSWQGGKSLTWNGTLPKCGGAAEIASVRKVLRYSTLPADFTFQPIAFETHCHYTHQVWIFRVKLRQMLSTSSGDPCETSCLFQCLSNATAEAQHSREPVCQVVGVDEVLTSWQRTQHNGLINSRQLFTYVLGWTRQQQRRYQLHNSDTHLSAVRQLLE